jgi:CspA family cold shock protein
MKNGIVKWFNEDKGYGFIEIEGDEADVFVHKSAVKEAGLRTLKEGQEVSFEIDDSRGKPAAKNLEV